MPEQFSSLKLTGKDLIHIGIFSAVYFVLSFVGMFLGIIPILWILMPGVVALIAGIPFLLLSAKVQKPGVSLLMGLVTALLYYVTGQFTIVILTTFAAGSLLSELARWLTKYGSFRGNTLAFILFSYGMTGSPLPIWLFRDKFLAQISEQGIPDQYIETLNAAATTPMLFVLLLSPVVGGLIGAFIARRIFKKHFAKAGMI
ncbi:MAG: MptD family putative ECF transporter S component [Peptostreptococcaceae bacterium]|nr:MptD family putative ECF transporter S component [Peptostreptococcaceae bacterium]